MKSDMKALFKLIGASFLLAIVLMGILIAAALEVISREVAVPLALVGFVVGAVILGLVFRGGLTKVDREHNADVEQDDAG